MSANCTECGRDTPKKIYLCTPCLNFDPDYGDYRTEEEIRYEEDYWEDMYGVCYSELENEAYFSRLHDLGEEERVLKELDDFQSAFDAFLENMIEMERTAFYALTGN